MARGHASFVMGAEIECLTAVSGRALIPETAAQLFVERIAGQAPSLPARLGFFNGYGRVYPDLGHVELALSECDDPYQVPSIFERMQILATRAVEQLAQEGIHLILANNNHSGLLTRESPFWGSHESHATEQHPTLFGQLMLPFLVTRLFHGAGGIHYPTGEFLAAVRPLCMRSAFGGGTTSERAIHSTAREEHLTGTQSSTYRYHLLLGDGHRSHFNLALQYGTTALAIKAVLTDRQLSEDVNRLQGTVLRNSVTMLQRLNRLAVAGEPLCVDAMVIDTQRLYLEAARRYVASLDTPPPWMPRMLRDWDDTLTAWERLDRTWLAARLDAFAKYEFFSAVIRDAGHDWESLPQRRDLFCELALLDQSYHEFCNPASVFAQLESAGLLQHRVSPQILPGTEPEPFVPETGTRARARARFIHQHRGRTDLLVDWDTICHRLNNSRCSISDPWAREVGDWAVGPSQPDTYRLIATQQELLGVIGAFDRGMFESANARLQQLVARLRASNEVVTEDCWRYQAWLSARRGYSNGPLILSDFYYRRTPRTLQEINDYCYVYRFRALVPDLLQMQPWIDSGIAHLYDTDTHLDTAAVFREHAASAALRHGKPDLAWEMIEPALQRRTLDCVTSETKGRVLATAGEALCLIGDRRRAGRYLMRATQTQLRGVHFASLADLTYLALAKWERRRHPALAWIAKACAIQTRNMNRRGHAHSLLLEARLCSDSQQSDQNRERINDYCAILPALGECAEVRRILQHWDAWTRGEPLPSDDRVWGGL